MRIAFDMQAFQSVNKIGGIGRYNFDFINTLFTLRPEYEYTLYFNGRDTEKIAQRFPNLTTCRSKSIPYLPGNDLNSRNGWVHYLNYRFASMDIFHILSPFEDQKHTVISSTNIPAKTVVTLYDFIPYIFKETYLPSREALEKYMQRAEVVKSADHIVSISEATRQDAIRLFDIPPDKITNIGIAPSEEYFQMGSSYKDLKESVRQKFGLPEKFILTVINMDKRKNMPGLLSAYAMLPKRITENCPLVMVTNTPLNYIYNAPEVSAILSANKDLQIKMLFGSSNEELCVLYNLCSLFVFASFYEGGGLPVVEAMKCGAPVVASNSSSIPEFVGRKDNLFDPKDRKDIAAAMEKVLTNKDYEQELRTFGMEFSKGITWKGVVQKAIEVYDNLVK